jgi:hypothetical protein
MAKFKKARCCWIAKERKKGWRLGMAFEDETTYLDRWFKSIEDIKKCLKLACVFVHSKDSSKNTETLRLKRAAKEGIYRKTK